jgi:hypothetical protein
MLIGSMRMLPMLMLIVPMLIVMRAMATRLLLLLSLLCMLMLLTREGNCAGVMHMHLHTSCMTVTSLVKWRGTVGGATREIMPMAGQKMQGMKLQDREERAILVNQCLSDCRSVIHHDSTPVNQSNFARDLRICQG